MSVMKSVDDSSNSPLFSVISTTYCQKLSLFSRDRLPLRSSVSGSGFPNPTCLPVLFCALP